MDLQWGRTLSSAESSVSQTLRAVILQSLQWGRTLSSAESRETPPLQAMRPILQWGRTLSSAESFQADAAQSDRGTAFNGAALFQVRKASGCAKNVTARDFLQWGRTLSSAESLERAVQSVGSLANLQWGRTLSSAESGENCRSRTTKILPSMGPHSFKCGKNMEREIEVAVAKAFNGAALFQVRKATPIMEAFGDSSVLQWGRTLSSAESGRTDACLFSRPYLQWGRTLSSAESSFGNILNAS